MGVTLERVQNKFACIIGELCSEPLLLSQFAIWVDLRISEYKSKGTISLDCSGSNPDPSWLKGHINPGLASGESNRSKMGSSANIRNSLPHKSIHSSRDSSRLSHSLYQNNNRNTDNVDNSESASERLSPDVIIKDDPDAVFPISIHKHEIRSPAVRKRVADPSYSTDQDLSQQGENYYQDSFSTPKMRRVDSASDDVAVDSPSNQSFMSVIGDSLQDGEDVSQIDNNSLTPGDGQSRGGTNLPINQRFSSPSASFSPMPSTSATPGSSGGQEASSRKKRDSKKRYDCTQCGKIFSRTDHLRRHIMSHMTSPPKIPCPICEKKFGRKDHLIRHIKTKHFEYINSYENTVVSEMISREKQDLINNEIYKYYHAMQDPSLPSVNTSMEASHFQPGQTSPWELPTQSSASPTVSNSVSTDHATDQEATLSPTLTLMEVPSHSSASTTVSNGASTMNQDPMLRVMDFPTQSLQLPTLSNGASTAHAMKQDPMLRVMDFPTQSSELPTVSNGASTAPAMEPDPTLTFMDFPTRSSTTATISNGASTSSIYQDPMLGPNLTVMESNVQSTKVVNDNRMM